VLGCFFEAICQTKRDLSYTTDQLQALEDAFAEGVLEVTFQGRRTVFASGADLERRINLIKNELVAQGSGTAVRQIRIFQDDET
jgi:hypothetical protein